MTTKTKERPILFSGPMVRAILDGMKTQTRRALKVQPPKCDGRWSFIASSTEKGETGKFRYSWLDANGSAFTSRGRESGLSYRCPYGSVGDRLWVREAWAVVPHVSDNGPKHKAKGDGTGATWRADWQGNPSGFKWRPSIHMPRWASRITLEITGVRVERLQDISNADALAEGVSVLPGHEDFLDEAIQGFEEIWNRINGPGSWDANPWVWVVEFRRIEA